jgi:hypothetical protein
LRREISESTTEIVLKHKKFLGTVSMLPTLGVVWIVAILFTQLSVMTQNRALQGEASKDEATAFAIAWAIMEMALCSS